MIEVTAVLAQRSVTHSAAQVVCGGVSGCVLTTCAAATLLPARCCLLCGRLWQEIRWLASV